MIENDTVRPGQYDIFEAPDTRSSDPVREIHRGIGVLRYLEALRIADLIRPRPPAEGKDLVSVVVPMYNARRWITLCLKSLLVQTHTNLEVFCVDDASDDDTYERVVAQFGRDRRLCVVRLGRNVGPYQIKNWVIGSLARGRVVALQDADDVSHPTRIAEQWGWMQRRRYRICGPCVHQFYPPHIHPDKGHTEPVEAEGLLHNLVFYSNVARTQEPVCVPDLLNRRKGFRFIDHQGQVNYAAKNGSVAVYGGQLFDRSLFLAYGGFDGRTKVGADKEFNWRLLRFHRIGNLPKVLYSRRLHRDSLTEHPATGRTSAMRKHYDLKRIVDHERIREALAEGDLEHVRALCISDLYHGDVEVEDVHTGFELHLGH